MEHNDLLQRMRLQEQKRRGAQKFLNLKWHVIPKNAHSSIHAAMPKQTQQCSILEPYDRHVFTFMVVREPYDRMLSAWKFFCRDYEKNKMFHQRFVDLGYRPDMSVEEFGENFLLKAFGDEHTQPQTSWIGSGVDQYVPIERLNSFWMLLRSFWPQLAPLGHVHRSMDIGDRYEVTGLANKVNDLFAADMEIWLKAQSQNVSECVDFMSIASARTAAELLTK